MGRGGNEACQLAQKAKLQVAVQCRRRHGCWSPSLLRTPVAERSLATRESHTLSRGVSRRLSPTCSRPREQGARRNARSTALRGGRTRPDDSCEPSRGSASHAASRAPLDACQLLGPAPPLPGCASRDTGTPELAGAERVARRSAQRRRQHASACRELSNFPRATRAGGRSAARRTSVNDTSSRHFPKKAFKKLNDPIVFRTQSTAIS